MSDVPDNPLAAAGDGRSANGRFGAGNTFGKGNPFAKRTQAIRAALMEVCEPSRIKAAAEALLAAAESGDRFAFAELLDRTIGRPVAADLLERIEAIEALLEQQNGPEKSNSRS